MLRVLVREQTSLCRALGRKCSQESWDLHDTEVEMLTRAPGTETSGGLLSTGVLLMCVYFDPCCGVMLRLFWTEAKLLTVSGSPAPMWGRSLGEGPFFSSGQIKIISPKLPLQPGWKLKEKIMQRRLCGVSSQCVPERNTECSKKAKTKENTKMEDNETWG